MMMMIMIEIKVAFAKTVTSFKNTCKDVVANDSLLIDAQCYGTQRTTGCVVAERNI